MQASPYENPGRYERRSHGLPGDVDFYLSLCRSVRAPVLDLGCGTGRLTIPIAQTGIPIIGMDRSPAMLSVAQQRGSGIPNLDWVQSDMRRYSLSLRFGLVFVAYRGFSHLLTDGDQRSCLQCISEHLSPGAQLALDVANPSALRLQPRAGSPLVGSPLFSPLILKAERGLRLRYMFVEEMRHLLVSEGFEVEALYGSFDRRPFSKPESSEMIWIARRR